MLKKNGSLPLSLLLLRLGVFIVMFMWTLDKFVNPGHSAAILEKFYFLDGVGTQVVYAFGALEMLLILGFILGYQKKWTYGIVLFLHASSTLSAFGQYFDPWNHLLFFAAWPMLAACIALYLLRDDDTLFALEKSPAARVDA
ncbi:MAG: putative oxidoreductase [Janthinobacterium sp.]|jgi:putative oxidoreductase